MEEAHLGHDLESYRADACFGETATDVSQLVEIPIALSDVVANQEDLVLGLKGVNKRLTLTLLQFLYLLYFRLDLG